MVSVYCPSQGAWCNAKITEDKFDEIIRETNKIYTTAKKFAVTSGRLGKDPDFQQKFMEEKFPGFGLETSSVNSPEVEELLSMAK